MTFANCPKCGSSNVTTAGVCANCGWTRFPQVMGAGESEEAVYELVGEIEIKVTGKALLDDYKRLLFENNSLTVRIAELETKIRHNALWQASEDAEERAHLEKLVLDLKKRIAELTECIGSQMADVYTLKARIAELETEKECEMRVFKDGNAWCFVLPDFQDLQVSSSVWMKKGVLDKIYKELRSVQND